jgi:hypothetical protein
MTDHAHSLHHTLHSVQVPEAAGAPAACGRGAWGADPPALAGHQWQRDPGVQGAGDGE